MSGVNTAFNFANNRKELSGTCIATKFNGGVIICCNNWVVLNNGIVIHKLVKNQVFKLADNIYCGGIGIFADVQYIVRLICVNLELLRNKSKRENCVNNAIALMKRILIGYYGSINVHLTVVGIDRNGTHVISILPHSSTDNLPYICIGNSHTMAANAFDLKFVSSMKEDLALELVKESMRTTVLNDLQTRGSSHVVILRDSGSVELFWSNKDLGISDPPKRTKQNIKKTKIDVIHCRVLSDYEDDGEETYYDDDDDDT